MPLDMNKAYGAGASAMIGGGVAKLARRALNYKWPGFVDDATFDVIDDLATACVTILGTYLTPHTKAPS